MTDERGEGIGGESGLDEAGNYTGPERRVGRVVYSQGPIIRRLEIVNGFVALAAVASLIVALASSARTSDQARQTAQQAKVLATRFQQQRIENVRGNCVATDARNANTKAALKREIADIGRSDGSSLAGFFEAVGIHVSPAQARGLARFQQQQAISQEQSTIDLIDALQPSQDCRAAVLRAEGKIPPQRPNPPPAIPPIILPTRR